jgi:DNA-binding transcriptional MerR regulator
MARNGLQIGKVSEQTGLSVDAIRFYEKQRLLERPPRTEGGFRLFNTQDIERIQFIRRAQRLGFSLPEIRELLLIQREQRGTCSHIRELLQIKIGQIHSKAEELRLLEDQLTLKLRKCERKLNASGDSHTGRCPVLDEIGSRGSDES